MLIDFTRPGEVVFDMTRYLKEVLDLEDPELLLGGDWVRTPAGVHLFRVDPNAEKLSKGKSEEFHSVTAKLLFMSRRAQPEIKTPVAFLITRVQQPDVHDWEKLKRTLCYLKNTQQFVLLLLADSLDQITWFADSSFVVHHDGKSHTGSLLALGQGAVCPVNRSSKDVVLRRQKW